MILENNREHHLYWVKRCTSFQRHGWIQTTVIVRRCSIRVKICSFVPCEPEIWQMTWKNNRASLLYYVKHCASLQSHQWIQTWVTVRKRSIWIKIDNLLSRMTLKFDGQPWNTTGHLYAASTFVHHFIAINWFNLELQSGSAKFRSKSMIFVLCDLKIWRMTLKNNRAPLVCYLKLCASFQSHWWTGVTVRKRPLWVKIEDFFSRVTLKFDGWPWKSIGHLS